MLKKKSLSLKIFSLIVLSFMLLNSMPSFLIKADASNMTTVTPNTAFTGQLEEKSSTNYYSFTVDKSGYFNIEFSIVDITADVEGGWTITLYYTDTGESIYSTTVTTNTTLPTFNFKQGTNLYIGICQDDAYWDDLTDDKFKINIKTVSNAAWEQESNDSALTATEITGNKTYYGNIYTRYDYDYYKYTVTQDGYIDLNFGLVDVTADTGDGWKIVIYNADTSEELLSYSTTTANTYSNLNFAKGTNLLVVITSKDAIWGCPKFVDYTLKISETSNAYWEKETLLSSDDSWTTRKEKATTVTLGKSYDGNLMYAKDNDLFKITVPKTGNLTVNFNPNEVESNLGYGYTIKIYKADGTLFKTLEEQKTTYNEKLYLKKGTYYVEIYASDAVWGAPTSKTYTLSASFKASKVKKVKSVSKKNTKVSWKKVSGAEGYEIAYSTKKTFKKSKTTTTTTTKKSSKLTSLKKGKIYYVRVRAYKTTATGDIVYGSWSKVIKVKKK